MTLLQGQYVIDKYVREHAAHSAVDLGPIVKSRLLQDVSQGLTEREDLFEIEHYYGDTVYGLKLHVFSEAELIDYRNSIIAEFMGYTGVFRAMRPQQKEDNNG